MVQFKRVLPLVFALAVLFSAPRLASAQFFATRASSPVNLAPYYIAVGDFNQDGKQDMAMAGSSNIGQVGVLLGNGNGTFQKAVYYAVGAYPKSIAVADFNNDGQVDLAVANLEGISILFGNGDGTFQPQNLIVQSEDPIGISVGDFNGDQILDLATVNSGGTFSILIGNGDGSFQSPIFTTPATLPATLGIGDFNGDGKLDVATAGEDFTSSHLDVFLGNGDGTFTTGMSYLVGSTPLAMVVGDFRNIGKLDLVTATLFGGISVLLGNGDGTFQQTKTYSDYAPEAIATADFNRDGKLDFVTAEGGGETGMAGAHVFLGNGDGTFQPAVAYPHGLVDHSVAVGDFNGDQWPDVTFGDSTLFEVITLLNTGVVSFSPTAPVLFPAQLLNTTSSPQTVTLTNKGTTTLSITSITVQGSNFRLSSSTTCGTSVAPGASCKIVTLFHPQTKGLKSALISIRDSASTKPQVIELFGSGTIVTVAPTQLNFPPTKKGTKSAPQIVTVTNKGTVALNITKVALGGDWPNQYSQTNTCPTQLAAGASCTISVTFMPNAKGSWPANASITDDGGGSPQTVTLTGRGT